MPENVLSPEVAEKYFAPLPHHPRVKSGCGKPKKPASESFKNDLTKGDELEDQSFRNLVDYYLDEIMLVQAGRGAEVDKWDRHRLGRFGVLTRARCGWKTISPRALEVLKMSEKAGKIPRIEPQQAPQDPAREGVKEAEKEVKKDG